MTLSVNDSSCLVFTNAFDRVLIFMRFEKLTRILGIARDAGRLSANQVASFVSSEWMGSTSTQTRRAQ